MKAFSQSGYFACLYSLVLIKTASPKTKVYILNISVLKKGLSNENVTAILQDSKGYMWFGTWMV